MHRKNKSHSGLAGRRKVVEIVRLHGAAGNFVHFQDKIISWRPPPAALGQRDGGLGATKPLCQLRLGKPSAFSPSDKIDHDTPSAKVIYCGTLYFRRCHKQDADQKYKQMTYPLVMKPRNRVRELRKAHKISQAELAELAGISQPAISQIENDTRPLSLDWMRTFARIFKCAPADLLDDQDNPDRLTHDERHLIENLRNFSPEQLEMALRLLAPGPRPTNDDRKHTG